MTADDKDAVLGQLAQDMRQAGSLRRPTRGYNPTSHGRNDYDDPPEPTAVPARPRGPRPAAPAAIALDEPQAVEH